MSVILRKQRDGRLRPFWYGKYVEAGTRKVVNLDVAWKGTPPKSLSLREPGDRDFELSREKADEVLARFVAESTHKGHAEHLTERLIASKTGRAVEYVSIADLSHRWRNLGRAAPASEEHLVNCDAHFHRFRAMTPPRS